MDIEKITRTEQLSGDQRELAETIGIESYKRLVEYFGDCQLYVPKLETFLKDIRNEEIKENFNGSNYRELAKKYSLSEMTIRRIVS